MFGICVRIGWFGFGRKSELFTHWLDLGVFGIGFTPLVARASVDDVAERARKIRDAIPALVGKVRR